LAPRFARAGPVLVGLALGLLAIGPGIAPGFLLTYDMVFVPAPPLSAATFGLTGGPPRAVPSDAVVALFAHVIPADVVQKLMLLLIFVLACSGAAALLDAACRAREPAAAKAGPDGRADAADAAGPAGVGGPAGVAGPADLAGVADPAGPAGPVGMSRAGAPLLARVAAGGFYAWNPFIAERLIIGQWALLLGYAGLPWVLGSLCCGPVRVRAWRLAAAFIPAAVGGFTAISLSAPAAMAAALARGGRRARVRRVAVAGLVIAVGSAPWLVPALLVPVHTDPLGADLFAARADTPFGRLGSLLMLGGAWNAETVPRGYGGAVSAAWLVIVIAAVAGYVSLVRPRRLCPGVGVAALVGLAIAAIGLTVQGRGVLRELIGIWPGIAVLRDGQQYLAPLALAEAVGLGAAVTWLLRDLRMVAAGPAVALGLMAALAPAALLPGLAWGAAGRLHPVQYPADWLRARRIIDGDSRPGAALVLPWAAYRRYPWNRAEAVFDPWSRMLRRRVIFNDGLRVGDQTLSAEDPAARRLGPVIASAGPMTQALRAAGVRYVVIDSGPLLGAGAPRCAARAARTARAPRGACAARAAQPRLPGANLLLASDDLVLFRLSPSPPGSRGQAHASLPELPIFPGRLGSPQNGLSAGQRRRFHVRI
jgi:hypothetical protein